MPARTRFPTWTAVATAVAAAAVLTFASVTSSADDAPDPDDAIERARALEGEGHLAEAYRYLAGLVADSERLSRDASVLIELSRLTPSTEESVELLEAAVERARDDDLAATARTLLGDYMYARGSYLEAAEQYEAAAQRAPSGANGPMLLKAAASKLAAGDATAAAESYEHLARRGSTPDSTTPWAMLGLGRALLTKGDVEEAAAEFEMLAQTYLDHNARPSALAGAAEAFTASGETEKARGALETLMRDYPGTYDSILAREDLRSLPTSEADTLMGDGSEAPPGDPEEAENGQGF